MSKILGISLFYLSHGIKNEEVLLSDKVYYSLCKLVNLNFDDFIIEKLEDNWGKSKGGMNSKGSTINILKPAHSCELAEFVGAVLGDGHVFYRKGKKLGV